MKRKHISIEEFSDGFQFSVNSGWREVTWQEPAWSKELGIAASYMKCENDICGNTPYHLPPKWESYGEHEAKHTHHVVISEETWAKLEESSQRRARERTLPDIIDKYRRERDEA